MARLVLKSDTGPRKIEVGGEAQFICMCGLSRNQPLCDGSHKACRDEEPGKVYRYGENGREEVP